MHQADLSMCFISCILFAEVWIYFTLPVMVGNTDLVFW